MNYILSITLLDGTVFWMKDSDKDKVVNNFIELFDSPYCKNFSIEKEEKNEEIS